MFFVTGIHPELSQDDQGRVPNEAFFAAYKERFERDMPQVYDAAPERVGEAVSLI